MSTPPAKPKLRWWQFSLRKFVLLVTLFSVLAVAFWRYREWGRQLTEMRVDLEIGVMFGNDEPHELAEFDRRYWLPLRVYESTSWDDRLGSENSPVGRTLSLPDNFDDTFPPTSNK